jgi:hypothetical protein
MVSRALSPHTEDYALERLAESPLHLLPSTPTSPSTEIKKNPYIDLDETDPVLVVES